MDKKFNIIKYHLPVDEDELFTFVVLPKKSGKFPTVIWRCPYEDQNENNDEELYDSKASLFSPFVERGYTFVYQQCRGRGRSTGEFIPLIYERHDGTSLINWIKEQPFFNGEIYLMGASYTALVHYLTTPWDECVKGASLEVMMCDPYDFAYRNGFLKTDNFYGEWWINQYKAKSNIQKDFSYKDFLTLPFSNFTKKVFGESVEVYDRVLSHSERDDPFWKDFEGADVMETVSHANIPILLSTGMFDLFEQGVCDIWHSLDENTREKSVLAIHGYAHGDAGYDQPYAWENASIGKMVPDFQARWFDYIRGVGDYPFPRGKISYYEVFGGEWYSDDFASKGKSVIFALGNGEYTYTYDPSNPAEFLGGLTNNFKGSQFQNSPGQRQDILTFYTSPAECDMHVRGHMKAKLTVASDCPDTCFYVRVSIEKKEGDFALRDDINQISNFCSDYKEGDALEMDFTFDECAFKIHRGERLRVDVSSSCYPFFVPHTNNKGLYSEQTEARVAHNTLFADKSCLVISAECEK